MRASERASERARERAGTSLTLYKVRLGEEIGAIAAPHTPPPPPSAIPIPLLPFLKKKPLLLCTPPFFTLLATEFNAVMLDINSMTKQVAWVGVQNAPVRCWGDETKCEACTLVSRVVHALLN